VQVLYTNEAIAVNELSLEASRKNEERGQQMLQVGKMSKADLAQLSSQRATDEYNLIAAKTDLADCKLQLKQLLEITGEQEFDVALPTADDAQALADIPDLLSVYEAALAQRPEIKNAELALQASDVQRKIARAGYMPTISMTGGVGTSTSTNNANEWGQQMKTNFDASAGVGVSVPIFDQRKTRTAINKANLQREEALLNMENKRKTIYQNVEGYWLDAQSYQQKFRAAIANVESETQSYSLLSEQFELGLKNIVELMTGKARLVKAQQNMLQSKYMTILSLQMLKFYRGEEITI
jgi:outer membrane protein